MQYYHGSPIGGLKWLRPGKPCFDKPVRVYLTSLYPMALMYGIDNFEYAYGYTREGRMYLEEYFPNALEELYGGKSGYVYVCKPEKVESTRIPNEWLSEKAVEILDVIEIPDLKEELERQAKLGAIDIVGYEKMSPKMREWLLQTQAKVILDKNYLITPCPGASYMQTHYPESWELALSKKKA